MFWAKDFFIKPNENQLNPKHDGGGSKMEERGCERLLERDNRYREEWERMRDISRDTERQIMRDVEREGGLKF